MAKEVSVAKGVDIIEILRKGGIDWPKTNYSILSFILFLGAVFLNCQSHNSSEDWKKYQDDDVVDAIDNVPNISPQDYGDILNTFGDFPDSDQLKAATNEFGFSTIDMETLPRDGITGEANIIPWSSWWFPKFENGLITSDKQRELSPLEKYDVFRNNVFLRKNQHLVKTSAVDLERERTRNEIEPAKWEGLCDAWALAAIHSPEPKRSIKYISDAQSFIFSISDLKALLLKTYEAVPDDQLKYYGQQFKGDHTAWIFPDLFPEQLHRLVEVLIFEKNQPFIMDYDPSMEIWNVPVFKATIHIVPDINNPNMVRVKLWLYSADPFLKEDKNKTGLRKIMREYHYILMGERNGNTLTVKSGIWIKGPNHVDSRNDHPDYVITIPDSSKITRKSYNEAFSTDVVDAILKRSFDD